MSNTQQPVLDAVTLAALATEAAVEHPDDPTIAQLAKRLRIEHRDYSRAVGGADRMQQSLSNAIAYMRAREDRMRSLAITILVLHEEEGEPADESEPE